MPQTKFLRHELKIVLSTEDAGGVQKWAQARLEPDAFAASDASYLVHTLYLDSRALDIYNRTWDEDGTKYRIRRYGTERVIWLERKRRKKTVVSKLRAPWSLDRLSEILEGDREFNDWPGTFKKEILVRRLLPRLLVSYPRHAWNAGDRSRLTMDWTVDARIPSNGDPFLLDTEPVSVSQGVILELKYDDRRPAVFEELLRFLGRESESFSKYSRGVEATGLVITRGIHRLTPSAEPSSDNGRTRSSPHQGDES
jgi:hypothetical protein